MKKTIAMLALLVMTGALCTGCNKDVDEPKPETSQHSQESDAKDWEPEMSEDTTESTQDNHDHDHSVGDHTGHSH